jgi:thiamine-phosphate pyrophosphorylase
MRSPKPKWTPWLVKTFDPSLYLVTDPGFPSVESDLEALIEAGVTMVQLRDKELDTRSLLEVARRLLERLSPFGIPLIVNDRVDVAVAAGAAGVHLGQRDLPLNHARRILGTQAIIGVSLEHPDQSSPDADYVAASPVFGTPTKRDTAPPLGLEGVRTISRAHATPTVGIGGIGVREASSVVRAGAAGVAVISAILGADDRPAAARALRSAVDAARSAGRRTGDA